MELGAGLDGHAWGVGAHDPVPFAEHLDHLVADLRRVAEDLLPVQRQGRTAAATAEEVEERVGDEEAPHGRIARCVLKDVRDVV